MTMALEGIRVIDMTIWQHGPCSTAILADMGAEVIKIEDRNTGDPGRYLITWAFNSPNGDTTALRAGLNYYFENNNRNKKSLALDLKTPEGRDIVHRLVKNSDVFVSNFREPSLKRLGLDYEAVHKINPKLVYAEGYGFGPKGPDASRPSADLAAQARSGYMSQMLPDRPIDVWGGPSDQTGAFMLCLGVCMGLIARERFGIGQKVEESLLGSTIALGCLLGQGYLFNNQIPTEFRKRALSPFWNTYKCKDDKWLCLSVIELERYWHPICQALNIEWAEEDPRFQDPMDRAVHHADELIAILECAFAQRTRAQWGEILNKTDIIWAPLQTYNEVFDDPQVIENEYVVEIDHPNAGRIKMLGLPIKMSETPGKVRAGAPELGQHTEEILTETLGYSWDEVTSFKDKHVIR